jgi:hypothetical protein
MLLDENSNGSPRLIRMPVLGWAHFLISLLGLIWVEPSFAQAPLTVPAAEASVRINQHADLISSRIREMNLLYEGKGFGGDLEGHLSRAGADAGLPFRHILRWGWEAGRSYYSVPLQALNDSIAVIQSQGYAVKTDLDYLDRGMEGWKPQEEKVQGVFADAFSTLVRTGELSDELPILPKIDPKGFTAQRFFQALKPDAEHSAPGFKEGAW